MENTIERHQTHNYGIDILRFLLAVTIVFGHFWTDRGNSGIGSEWIKLQNIAAPSFFLLSFFLSAKYILGSDQQKQCSRLKRLLLPFYFWGIVGWTVAALLLAGDKNSVIMSLIWQLFTGSSSNAPLWYLIVLVWITSLYFYIFKIRNKIIAVMMIAGITVASLILQYTGVNYWLFGDHSFEVKYTFGRIIEMIPYASAGMLLWYVCEKLSKNVIFLACGIVGIILYHFFCYSLQPNGFGYAGIPRLIGATSLVMFFVSLPLQTASKPITMLIKNVTNYTLGIYCMHSIVGTIIEKTVLIENQILLCVLIYIVSYFISFVISRIKKCECLVK